MLLSVSSERTVVFRNIELLQFKKRIISNFKKLIPVIPFLSLPHREPNFSGRIYKLEITVIN